MDDILQFFANTFSDFGITDAIDIIIVTFVVYYLLKLILEKKSVAGSTGTILLSDGFLSFYRKGEEMPAAHKSLTYMKT